MPTYPHSPRLLKGAIVAIRELIPVPTLIAFQYNPEAVKRSLQPQMAGGEEGQHSLMVRYTGAPVETIDLEVFIDATDQLEASNPLATNVGIYPQLSLLETLVYPASLDVLANDALLALGTLEVAPLAAPLTLFVWGPNRVLPVRLNMLSISEELFDTNLNPIRATVSLNMRALSYSDMALTSKGYSLFMAYQMAKESMAALGLTNSSGSALGVSDTRF